MSVVQKKKAVAKQFKHTPTHTVPILFVFVYVLKLFHLHLPLKSMKTCEDAASYSSPQLGSTYLHARACVSVCMHVFVSVFPCTRMLSDCTQHFWVLSLLYSISRVSGVKLILCMSACVPVCVHL